MCLLRKAILFFLFFNVILLASAGAELHIEEIGLDLSPLVFLKTVRNFVILMSLLERADLNLYR